MVNEEPLLVTGVPGWLGSRLAATLVGKNRNVRCLVMMGSNTRLLEIAGTEIVEGDILDKKSLELAVKDVRTVFHCAGVIHPKRPKDFYRINRDGTENMLEACTAAGVDTFIYVSSNSAQGYNRKRNILMTEDGPENPYTDYGKGKLQAERLVRKFHISGKIRTTIVRPCWFYGPRPPERMIKLIRMIRDGRPLFFGDGHNLRSMTYIDNLVDALLLIENNPKSDGQTYWIADERPYETIEIYRTIADYFGVRLRPRYIPGFISRVMEKADIVLGNFGIYEINIHVAGEMARNIACSIEKAKRELGYMPRFEIKEGMKRTIQWCQEMGLL